LNGDENAHDDTSICNTIQMNADLLFQMKTIESLGIYKLQSLIIVPGLAWVFSVDSSTRLQCTNNTNGLQKIKFLK
jgi:hypothetical protein